MKHVPPPRIRPIQIRLKSSAINQGGKAFDWYWRKGFVIYDNDGQGVGIPVVLLACSECQYLGTYIDNVASRTEENQVCPMCGEYLVVYYDNVRQTG